MIAGKLGKRSLIFNTLGLSPSGFEVLDGFEI